ncbi:FtsK/SpoIIIE domain-containing protein (plasmid) [Nitratidesulfovibrio vulgaris]|nr:FtsK/SpoIIIE domain-containing protein [Nitratidesulfovibrio vulgaris]WCB48131.1 FtsK/SpoIIIE domain-containing protein [Nitratidesulfovibrio vulgaris]
MRSDHHFEGLTPDQEQDLNQLHRDTRSRGQRFWDFAMSRSGNLVLLLGLAMSSLVYVSLVFPSLFCAVVLFWGRARLAKTDRLPFRVPMAAGVEDPGNPHPGRRKYAKASGIFFIGNEIGSGKELWLTAKDVLTHMMILGTTGSGKSETMVSLTFNALAMASGCFYIDPKAAPKLAHQIYTLARLVGRDDDFRVLNFATDKRPDRQARKPGRQTNTTNPFSKGTADQLTQLLVALIAKSEGGNAIFAQNAQTLITGVLYALVELRDRGELELSIDTIRRYLDVNKCDELARRKDLSETSRSAMHSAMATLGWNEQQPIDKQQKAMEQFGFARSYFGLPLANLADTYGHLYMTPYGEVDMEDIILQRRVLIVLLPALEMAPQQIESLGKICLSAVKNACAVGLGDHIEGTNEDVLDSLPVDSPVPFLSSTDEYAAITTPGYAEVFTQGRGLGIGGILGSQDYGGIAGKDPTGAKQFVANTKIKLFMCQEDGADTLQLVNQIAQKGLALQTSGYAVDKNSGTTDYLDTLSTQLREVDRIPFRDLNRQIEGEFIGFFKSQIVRGESFYTDLPLKGGQLRIGQMVTVQKPDARQLSARLGELHDLSTKLAEAIRANEPMRPAHIGQALMTLGKQLQGLSQAFATVPEGRQEQAICAVLEWGRMYEAGIAGFVANRTQQRDSARRKQEQMNSQGLVEIGLPESPLPQAPAPASVQSRLRIADVPIVPSTAEETPQGVAMSSSADPDALNVTAPEKQDEDGVPVGLPGLALLEQAWGQDQGDSTVHEDIVAGEIALGRSPAEAEEIAEEANTRIATHLGYPAPPVPEKLTEEEGEALTKAIELLLAD